MTTITTRGLTRSFGATTAVHPLDLDIPAGGIVGIVGPNGSGKSTTIRMLLGLIAPTGGTATVLGHDIADPSAYAHRVGALVENPVHLPGLSGRRNLEVLAALRGVEAAAIDRVLDVVGLTDRQHDPVSAYSLGMGQRLGIAAALLTDPDLLILDEPTNGLDPAGIKEVRDLLVELARGGRTVCASSHLLGEIQAICDHLVLLVYGVLRFAGPMADFMAMGVEGVRVATDAASEPALTALLTSRGLTHRRVGARTHVEVPPGEAGALNRACWDAGIGLSALEPVSSPGAPTSAPRPGGTPPPPRSSPRGGTSPWPPRRGAPSAWSSRC